MTTPSSVTAFPLQWPIDYPRTRHRKDAPYQVTGDKARQELERQLKLLGARDVIISTNAPLRQDGKPYADQLTKRHADPGVAVYFTRVVDGKKLPFVIACDRWHFIDHNIRAISLAVDGMRAIDRAGVSEMLERAFTGFKALPPPKETPGHPHWWDVLGVSRGDNADFIKERWLDLARVHHPDHEGGDAGTMAMINRAYDQFKAERGLA